MSEGIKLDLGGTVDVNCYSYYTPGSINLAMGDVEFVLLPGTEVVGYMTITILLGMPTTGKLFLDGTREGDQTITLNLMGKGYMTTFGQKPQSYETKITITMNADWQKGTLYFGEAVGEGKPLERKVCHS